MIQYEREQTTYVASKGKRFARRSIATITGLSAGIPTLIVTTNYLENTVHLAHQALALGQINEITGTLLLGGDFIATAAIPVMVGALAWGTASLLTRKFITKDPHKPVELSDYY